MKLASILLLGGILIGFALVAQFEPIRSDWGHLSGPAAIIGIIAALAGMFMTRRRTPR